MRKVLISPGYGAGWTTWESSRAIRKFMFEYAPIIDFLEKGGKFSRNDCEDLPLHPILKKFSDECMEKFGDAPYLGGAIGLVVRTVDGQVKIDEYDGYERIGDSDYEYL